MYVLLASVIITVGAGAMACGTLVSLVRSRAKLRRFVRVPGVVVDVRQRDVGTMEQTGSAPAYAPVLAFRTADGRDVQTESARWSNRNAGKAGQQVSVLYDPTDPSDAYLGSATGTPTFVYLLAFAIALLVFVVGALALLAQLG